MKPLEQVRKEFKNRCSDVFCTEFFRLLVRNNVMTRYDGIGIYHDGEQITNKRVDSNSLYSDKTLQKYPYIIWYNK